MFISKNDYGSGILSHRVASEVKALGELKCPKSCLEYLPSITYRCLSHLQRCALTIGTQTISIIAYLSKEKRNCVQKDVRSGFHFGSHRITAACVNEPSCQQGFHIISLKLLFE